MITVGIDVGLTGAVAALDQHGDIVYLADLPIAKHRSLKWVDGEKLYAMLMHIKTLCGVLGGEAYIEHIHAMPEMGSVAANSKGLTLGSVLSIVQLAKLPYTLVVPSVWKRALGLLSPGATDREKKQLSLDAANNIFSGTGSLARKKDNGRAEALLIAYYGANLTERSQTKPSKRRK